MVGDRQNRMSRDHPGFGYSLTLSVLSIGVFLGSLLGLNPEDRLSWPRGCFYTSLGFIHFISLTDFLNKLGLKLRNKYKLVKSDALDVANKFVSAFQALLSCAAGFVVCKSSCSRGFLNASHFMSEAYAWFGAAYFFYDLWSMYRVHLAKLADKLAMANWSASGGKCEVNNNCNNNNKLYDKSVGNGNLLLEETGEHDLVRSDNEEQKQQRGEFKEIHDDYGNVIEMQDRPPTFLQYLRSEPLMVIHHLFIGSFGLSVIVFLRGGLGDCIFSTIYMMEASTPFVSFRSILSTLGLRNHRIYVVNGLVMLVMFFIFRILLLPYLFYYYSLVVSKPILTAIMSLPRGCKIGICILFLPQYYWFYLIVRGAAKVLRPKHVKGEQGREDNGTAAAVAIGDVHTKVE